MKNMTGSAAREIQDGCMKNTHTNLTCSGVWKKNKGRFMFPWGLTDGNFQQNSKTQINEDKELVEQWEDRHSCQRHPAQLAEGFEPLSYNVKVGRNCPVACHAVVAERKFHSHPLIFTSAWSANWGLSNCQAYSKEVPLFSSPPPPAQSIIPSSKKLQSAPLLCSCQHDRALHGAKDRSPESYSLGEF